MHWPQQYWYRRDAGALASCLPLWPLSLLLGTVAALRRAAFHHGICAVTRLPVPVVVIGNISVGGTGKTPLTIALAAQLREQGWRPGIVCRGYGGSAQVPQAVADNADPSACGDEAVLLAQRSGGPVWIGADRVAAARGLLAANPDCNLILSDDGLQHYALGRNFEIAVLDAARGTGNGWLLPAGPLREPATRLATVNAVVVNGEGPSRPLPRGAPPALCMTLHGDRFFNLRDPQQTVNAAHFSGRKVHAVAAIGNPARFFTHLRALGIDCDEHAFPDHHAFARSDLAFGDEAAVIMTEKDAVKCSSFDDARHWALRVDAAVDGALVEQIMRVLGKPA
jgi:tetraacyldisaccharide 4'-kinase